MFVVVGIGVDVVVHVVVDVFVVGCVVYRVSFLFGILYPQFGVKVQLSSHQLTKIITLSPFFLLENQTKVGVVL